MKARMAWAGLVGLAVVLMGAGPSEATTYDLDAGASRLAVWILPARTLFSGFAHGHAVRATGWKGTVRWDPAQPQACRIEIELPVERLVADDATARKWTGLEGTVSEGNRSGIRKDMLAKSQLDAAAYPEIRFRAVRCEGGSGGDVRVTGDLTIRGKTKEVQVPMHFTVKDGTLRASGTFTATHADFGMKPFALFLGTVKNAEEIHFLVDVVGHARVETPS